MFVVAMPTRTRQVKVAPAREKGEGTSSPNKGDIRRALERNQPKLKGVWFGLVTLLGRDSGFQKFGESLGSDEKEPPNPSIERRRKLKTGSLRTTCRSIRTKHGFTQNRFLSQGERPLPTSDYAETSEQEVDTRDRRLIDE